MLVAGLVLTAGASGYLRTAHGLAGQGAQTLIICGSDGEEVITLGADGAPIDPATCGHCDACNLAPGLVLSSHAAPEIFTLAEPARLSGPAALPRRAAGIAPVSRGPPLWKFA